MASFQKLTPRSEVFFYLPYRPPLCSPLRSARAPQARIPPPHPLPSPRQTPYPHSPIPYQVSLKKNKGLSFFERPPGARDFNGEGLWANGEWLGVRDYGLWVMGLEDRMIRGEFKMTLDDTKIQMGVTYKGEFRLDLYAVVSVEDEGELLLINGSGR